MIPEREHLEATLAGTEGQQEAGYTPEEIDALCELKKLLEPLDPKSRIEEGRVQLREMWPDDLLYIRKTHWIKTKNPGERVLFKPNYAQQRFYRDVIEKCRKQARPIRAIILKARQLGFSTFMQSWQYEQCDRHPNRTSLTVSYDKTSTEELFQKPIFVRRNQWFTQQCRRDRNNVIELVNDSTFFTRTAGNSSGGRSQTFHHVHCSEIPMWSDADEMLASVLPAVPNREDTSIVFESTAKGATGPFYAEWIKADRGESDFIPFFAPWFWDPDYSLPFPSKGYESEFAGTLNLEERRLMERHDLTLQQLHWRRQKIRDECHTVRKFQQEYPSSAEEAFLTTGSPVFDAHAVSQLAGNAVPPLWRGEISLLKPEESGRDPTHHLQSSPAGHLRVWDEPKAKVEYVVGADIAEGRVRDKGLSGRKKIISYSDYQPDYSAACVVELESGLHVASWHGSINTFDFAAVLYAMALYYNQALVVPEINGPGIATVTCLVETLRYPKVYRSRQYAVMQNPGMATQYGWRTLPHTREHLMFRITEALTQGNLWTRDKQLIDEIRTMERDPNGNPRAIGNNKDDRVFALALALQGRYDVFGGQQERPGQDAKPVRREPDAWIWDQVLNRKDHGSDPHRRARLSPRHPHGRLDRLV